MEFRRVDSSLELAGGGVRAVAAALALAVCGATADVTLQTDVMHTVITDTGCLLSVYDRVGKRELVATPGEAGAFAVYHGRKRHQANSVTRVGDTMMVAFHGTDTAAIFAIVERPQYVAIHLQGLTGARPARVDLLALRLKPMPSLGTWINVAYDQDFGVCLCSVVPHVDAVMRRPGKGHDWVEMTAFASANSGLDGATAVLFGCPRPAETFLEVMDTVERDFGLPRGARGRRSKQIDYSYMWISPTVKTIDELIRIAKRAGFRKMLFSYTAFSKSCGHYPWRDSFPNGQADVKIIADRIRAAGLAVGMHIHYNKAHKHDPYVSGTPDERLHIARHFTISRDIDADSSVIPVNETPKGCTMDDGRRLLKLAKELVTYSSFSADLPYEFRGCQRGALKTQAVGHLAGSAAGLLNVDTWPIFVRFDQNTDIQDEVAARITKTINETGPYDMIYFDGFEDVHHPYRFHLGNAAYRVYRHIRPGPLVCEAAGNTHFTWHMMTRANAYDSVAPSQMKAFCRKSPCRAAPKRALNFTKVNFGWLHGFARADGDHMTPDVLEYVLSRGAAWDCPFSLTVKLAQVDTNPLSESCFDVIKIWEDVRIEHQLSLVQKQALRNLDAEHHLFLNARGEYELAPLTPIENVAGLGGRIGCWLLSPQSDPDATYALTHSMDEIDLTFAVAPGVLQVRCPFGKTLPHTREDGKPQVTVGPRRYLRFAGLSSEQTRTCLQDASHMLPPITRIWLSAADSAQRRGSMVLASSLGRSPEGALSGDALVPNAPGSMEVSGPDSCAEYVFTVPEGAHTLWYAWARCWYTDTNSNSFFLSVSGAGEHPQRFGNSYVWKKWLWERGGGMRLAPGRQVLKFGVRESQPGVSPLLDALVITNDPSYRPSDEDAIKGLKP